MAATPEECEEEKIIRCQQQARAAIGMDRKTIKRLVKSGLTNEIVDCLESAYGTVSLVRSKLE